MQYIINKNTFFIMFDGVKTIVNELSTDLIFEGNHVKNVIEKSCIYYGSSLKGRLIGSKNLINSKYKLPIIISEKNSILFFPIKGIKNREEIWINFNAIIDYKKDKEFVKVYFNDGVIKEFMVSYCVFNNQIYRCSRLWINYLSRI